MKKIVLSILFFLCYSVKFIRKDIKHHSFEVRYYYYPRWYSPAYIILISGWFVWDLLTLQPGDFFKDLKRDFNQKESPRSHTGRFYGNLSKKQINIYILKSIYSE